MHSTVIHDEQQGGSSIVCLTDRNDLQASSTNRLDHCRRWRAEIKRQAAARRQGTSSRSSNNALNPVSSHNQLVWHYFFSRPHGLSPPRTSHLQTSSWKYISYQMSRWQSQEDFWRLRCLSVLKCIFSPPPSEACLAFSRSNSNGRWVITQSTILHWVHPSLPARLPSARLRRSCPSDPSSFHYWITTLAGVARSWMRSQLYWFTSRKVWP